MHFRPVAGHYGAAMGTNVGAADPSDELRELREDLEALREAASDPVEAARLAYEALVQLRQNGLV